MCRQYNGLKAISHRIKSMGYGYSKEKSQLIIICFTIGDGLNSSPSGENRAAKSTQLMSQSDAPLATSIASNLARKGRGDR